MASYVSLGLLVVVAVVLAAVMVWLTTFLGPRSPSAVKGMAFEGGSDPVGSARERFSVKYYMVALLFIVFDIEAVFIYPWAVLLTELGWGAMIAMGLFVATLLVGLVYVWKKGALDWARG
jgi:NADH-quinone oxidoreductase subunit A